MSAEELRGLTVKALKQRALASGATEEQLEDAEEEDDYKGALVALVQGVEGGGAGGAPAPKESEDEPASPSFSAGQTAFRVSEAPAEPQPQPQPLPEPEPQPEAAGGTDAAAAEPAAEPAALPEGVPKTTLAGRHEDVARLAAAAELTGARVLVHGDLGVGRRSLMRECASHLRASPRWWLPGSSEDAFLLGLAEYGRQLTDATADSATALKAAKAVLESQTDWVLVVEDVRDAAGIVAHIPAGRGRCLFSSESDPAVWRGRPGEVLTCATKVNALPPADCVQLLCRIALQEEEAEESITALLDSTPSGASIKAGLEHNLACLPLGAKMLGRVMQDACAAEEVVLEGRTKRLQAGLEKLAGLGLFADAPGAPSSPQGALLPEPAGSAAVANRGAAQRPSGRGRAGPIGTIAVDIAERLIDAKAGSEEAALGARALLRCMAVLGDTAVAGVPEQLWTEVKLNESALGADQLARNRASGSAIDVTGELSQQFKARKPLRDQAESLWMQDKKSQECLRCLEPFNVRRRKHHCRRCGKVVCAACSQHRQPLPARGYLTVVRVCDGCYEPPLTLGDDDLTAPPEPDGAPAAEPKPGRAAKKRSRKVAGAGRRLFTDLEHYQSAVALLESCGLLECHRRSKDVAEDRAPYLTLHRGVQLALLAAAPASAEQQLATSTAMACLWTVVKWRFTAEAMVAPETPSHAAALIDDGSGAEPLSSECRALCGVAVGLLGTACPDSFEGPRRAGGAAAQTQPVLPPPLVSYLALALGRFFEYDLGTAGQRLAERAFKIAVAEPAPGDFTPAASVRTPPAADWAEAAEAASHSAPDVATVQQHSLRVASYRLALARNLLRQEGRAAEAAEQILGTVGVRRNMFGMVHEDTLQAMRLHVDSLRAHAPPRHEDASKVLQEMWQATEHVLGPWHPHTASTLIELASCASLCQPCPFSFSAARLIARRLHACSFGSVRRLGSRGQTLPARLQHPSPRPRAGAPPCELWPALTRHSL